MRSQISRTSDEDELAWEIHGEGSSPPIEILHGLFSTELHFRPFLAHYGRRRPVLSFHYRGHGRSPAPRDLRAVGIEPFADDAHAVLAASSLPRPAIVCGLSMGVQVALEQWRRHPDDVGALILICGTHGHPLSRLHPSPSLRRAALAFVAAAARMNCAARASLWPLLSTPLGRELAFLCGGAHRRFCPPEVLDELFAHVRGMDFRVVMAELASYLDHTASGVLETVRVPTLIIAGGDDQLTPPSRAQEMGRRIPGAEVVVLPGHTHLAQVECPERVHAIIDAFLVRNQLA